MSALGSWHPDVLGGLAALVGIYVWAGRRQASPPALPRILAFASGIACFTVALNGPLHDLSDRYLFSAHMLQHLSLTLVAPPLMLLGLAPGMLAPVLARRPLAVALTRLTRPALAFVLYNVALVVWHLPRPYNAALEHHWLHVVQHVTLIGTATLAWWPILSPEPRLPRASYPAQLLYLFLLGLPMTAVAALITAAEDPLYPFYAAAPRITSLTPIDDQRLGGLIMWVPAGIGPLAAFTAVFFRWAAAEREED